MPDDSLAPTVPYDPPPAWIRGRAEATRAIGDALVAHHGLRSALASDAPPFFQPRTQDDASDADIAKTSIAVALAHYGPGQEFDRWCVCRAMEVLRIVWTGEGTRK